MNVKHLEPVTSRGQATSAKEMSTKEGLPTFPVLRPSSKIRDRHWERLAIVYIRQSSPHQVLENRESRERQYALARLAQQFGWPADRVLVIDEDQGLSGKSSENREGFQRLLTEVTLDHVGLVLGFCYLKDNKIQFGFRCLRGPKRGQLEWRRPTHNRILAMLHHPIYAGAYAYGFHRPGRKNPVSGQVEGGKWFLPPDEIRVLIQGRVPAYISWEQYLANQRRLSENRSFPGSQGAARAGRALLSGLIVCGRCGHRMNVGYHPGKKKKPHYWCDTHLFEEREQRCFGLKAPPVDELVAQQVLRALEPAAVDLSLQAATDIKQERERLHHHYDLLVTRIKTLHQEGKSIPEIAERLNKEGFVPPRRRGVFSVHTVAPLMKQLGLAGELYRHDLLGPNEWWIRDLATKLKLRPGKVHYWVTQGWVHSRKTPSGMHWIVWADDDELERLEKLKVQSNSYTAKRNPKLVTPKARKG